MGYVLKRLALGIALIGLAAAVLLVSDRQHRQRVRPSGLASAARGKLPREINPLPTIAPALQRPEAGRNITRWPEYRRAKLIGRVFQNPFSGTAPHMTIAENLALATWATA